ncbi:MAG TPA: hypothetical protein DCY94_00455 [Firmicutes bacterium]|nr:hypothetical protein [Bacillota bacterium]
MKKKNLTIICMGTLFIILLIGASVFVVLSRQKDKEGSDQNNDQKEEFFHEDLSKEYPKIVKFLKSSKDYKNSKIEEDRESERIIIDSKYNIGLREGYAYFEISYDEEIDEYCKIIEAIESGLGAKESSKKACNYALTGSVVNDYMSVSYEEDKMLVIVNTKDAGDFSNECTFYDPSEKIAIGSRNFGMNIDGYNLSNTSSGYNSITNSTNVCFTVMNKSRVARDFKITYYDENDSILHEENYSYTGVETPAEHTCIKWENEDKVKYFSIERSPIDHP